MFAPPRKKHATKASGSGPAVTQRAGAGAGASGATHGAASIGHIGADQPSAASAVSVETKIRLELVADDGSRTKITVVKNVKWRDVRNAYATKESLIPSLLSFSYQGAKLKMKDGVRLDDGSEINVIETK